MKLLRSSLVALGMAGVAATCVAHAAPIYDPGLAPSAASSGITFGDHLLSGDPMGSVAGTGGSGLSNNADALNGQRTFTFDTSAQPDLTDGISNRGDPGFAMLIWDMGAAFDSMRLYTHQDHFNGAPVTTNFVAQDLMEYSVWGSNDGDSFVSLSDVLDFDIAGGGAGLPTYTFTGADPTIVYRGGSTEFGITNAYSREYVFNQAYRWYGIRTSQVSLTIPGGGIDADPEIDAIAGFNIADQCTLNPSAPGCTTTPPPNPVPEPSALGLLGLGLLGYAARRRAGKPA